MTLKYFKILFLAFTSIFIIKNSLADLSSDLPSHRQKKEIWFQKSLQILSGETQGTTKQDKLGNLWISDQHGKPVSIFKPQIQIERLKSGGNWRGLKDIRDPLVTSIARKLGWKDSVALVLSVGGKNDPIVMHEGIKLVGTIEPVISFRSHNLNSDALLNQWSLHVLTLLKKDQFSPVMLKDIYDLIDADTKKSHKKTIGSFSYEFLERGNPNFSFEDYTFFLEKINLESIQNLALIDMLIVHRDMKSDNVMLHVDKNSGISFVAIDWEYSFLTNSKNQDEAKKMNLHLRPFYLDFPQADLPLTQNIRQKFCTLNLLPAMRKIVQNNAKEEIDNFNNRLRWLQEQICVKKEDISIKNLHANFRAHFAAMIPPMLKRVSIFEKLKNKYNHSIFVTLNPKRDKSNSLLFNDDFAIKNLTLDKVENFAEKMESLGYQ